MVNRKRNYTLHFYLMAVLVAIAIGAVNYLGMQYRTRLDLTADQRFTLSEGTQRLFEKLTEPITVTYYVDAEPPAKRINLERDVHDKLEELAVSSGGKLEYKVERISNEDAAEKRKDLESKGITVTIDVLTSGTDERAETRGIQGYFSSLLIQYGTAEPKAINGIVNLVDKEDEQREHRVDTLEFDIAYTVLTMRNETRRPSFERLLKIIPGPVQMTFLVTENMPAEAKKDVEKLEAATKEIVSAHGAEVSFTRLELPSDITKLFTFDPKFDSLVQSPYDPGKKLIPAQLGQGGRIITVQTPDGPQRVLSDYYTACVNIRFEKLQSETVDYILGDFSTMPTAAEVRTFIEDSIWEMYRPRTRLGFILPPGQGGGQPGQPPRSGHSGVLSYIQSTFSYETSWVDLKTEKRVPRDLACLIVIEPNLLTERELYEIDQYLNEGGNVVMMIQGWSTELDFSFNPVQDIRLNKQDEDPAFAEWARHLGITFGQDMLLRKNGKLQPFMYDQQRRHSLIATPVRLAPIVEPQDLNAGSVFTRGLAAMPLPMVVETKIDNDRIRTLDLEQTDLIRLTGDVYKFIPESMAVPTVPLSFDLDSIKNVQPDPAATPGEDIRAQKLDHEPLVATLITGQFPSLWADEERNIPGWNGDPEKEKAGKVVNPGKGTLVILSTAAFLNTDYLSGYPQREVLQGYTEEGQPVFGPVIDRGLTFYRNMSEAFIYGDDLVSLRARTGVAPRIAGADDQGTRNLWFIICIAGMPLALMLLAGLRSFMATRERQEYELALGVPKDE